MQGYGSGRKQRLAGELRSIQSADARAGEREFSCVAGISREASCAAASNLDADDKKNSLRYFQRRIALHPERGHDDPETGNHDHGGNGRPQAGVCGDRSGSCERRV